MAVILNRCELPIREVAELGAPVLAIYSLLFWSAQRDVRLSKPEIFPKADCGGTSSWSHTAIAQTLKLGKAKVIQSLDILLDQGFVQVIGYATSSSGSRHRVYRVLHPEHVEDQRFILTFFDKPVSERLKTRERRNCNARAFE
jgi:hypothetical protein